MSPRHEWRRTLDAVDAAITDWMARHGIVWLRLALGLVFLWFGAVKFVPGWSPASELAEHTIDVVTRGVVPRNLGLTGLALWESAVGVGLLSGRCVRLTVFGLCVQLSGTMLPLLLFPDVTFRHVPYALTLEGQYIVKNLVLLSAAIVVGATVRGGGLVSGTPDPGESQVGHGLHRHTPDSRARVEGLVSRRTPGGSESSQGPRGCAPGR